MYILFVRAIITSTARASSVFLSSYRNTVLNQSACVFALGYFLTKDNTIYTSTKQINLKLHCIQFVIIRLFRHFAASMKKYHPAPWIYGKDKEQCPTYIWYWMREGEYSPPRSCMEVKTRSIGKEGVSGKHQVITREE